MRTIDVRYVRTETGFAQIALLETPDGYAVREDGDEIFAVGGHGTGRGRAQSAMANAAFVFDALTGRYATPRPVSPFPWNVTKDGCGSYLIETEGPDGIETIGSSCNAFVARAVANQTAVLAKHPSWQADMPAAPSP